MIDSLSQHPIKRAMTTGICLEKATQVEGTGNMSYKKYTQREIGPFSLEVRGWGVGVGHECGHQIREG